MPEVLFVCVHNAGRSQMAAALLDDPAHADLDSVRRIRDDIARRVLRLLKELAAATA